MLDNKVKLKVLQDIIESPTFKDAHRLRDLLSYLVKESVAGNKPKEAAIAIEVLGKTKDFDSKDDAIVRVYINNLRNKLEHYYLTNPLPVSGYRIRIPKGSYDPEFEPVIIPKASNHRQIYSIFSVVVLLLVCAVVYLWYSKKQSSQPLYASNPILNDVISSNNKPVLIIMGDFFFMNEDKDEGSEHYNVRDFTINTMDDFLNASKSNPDFNKRFSPGLYTYLRPSTSWGIFKLLPILKSGNKEIFIKLASQFTVDDLKSYNVIFIGQVKSLFTLQKLMSVYGIKCNVNANTLYVTSKDSGAGKMFTPTNMSGGKYENDYAVIAKGTGPEGTGFLLLMGFAEIGILGAVDAIIDAKSVSAVRTELEKLDDPDMKDFTAVFEAEGLNQTVFHSHLKYVVTRTPNFRVWEDTLAKK